MNKETFSKDTENEETKGIGEVIGVSESRVSQILSQSMQRLRVCEEDNSKSYALISMKFS